VAARHTPLLAAAAILAICVSGPATAAQPRLTATEGGLYGVRDADVPPFRLPVDVDRLVKAPQKMPRGIPATGRRGVPGVSVRPAPRPRKAAPRPAVSVPGVSVYDDAVCVDVPRSSVHVGRCRGSSGPPPPATRRPLIAVPAPAARSREPTPTPSATVVRARAILPAGLPPRESPLGTVLLMVVLTTVIASTTAVAFGAIR
jgi:hypothetical protein